MATRAADDPNCQEYHAVATVDGEQQPIVGRGCPQPDGTWKLTEGTPENPAQVVTIYNAPPSALPSPGPLSYAYPYPYPNYEPWLWGPFLGLGFGTSFVFVDHHHGHHGFGHGGFHGAHHHGGGHGGHGGGGHGGSGHGHV